MRTGIKPTVRIYDASPVVASFAHQLRQRGFKITRDMDLVSNTAGDLVDLCHFDVGSNKELGQTQLVTRIPQIAIVPLARKDAELEAAALRQGFSDVFYAHASAQVIEARLLAIRRRAETAARRSEQYLPEFYIWDRYVPLSPSQLRVLICLFRRRGCPVSRETLALHADQSSDLSLPSSVNCLVKRIRKKFAQAGVTKDLISARYGFGYTLDEDCQRLGLICRKPPTNGGNLDADYCRWHSP